jgi:hypothetical protein
MVAAVEALTTLVVTVNVVPVAPSGTVTLAGTPAAALSLESVTMAPLTGAGPVSVAVPVDIFPPTTLSGLTDTAAKTLGVPV